MADKKVSALSAVTSISSDDLFMVVNDPQGTPASNKVSVKSIFNSVPANTSITGRFSTTANNTLAGTTTTISSNTTVSGNLTSTRTATFSGTLHITGDKKFVLSTKSAAPGSGNAVAQGLAAGTIFYSNTHLYIVTDSNTIKRVALSAF